MYKYAHTYDIYLVRIMGNKWLFYLAKCIKNWIYSNYRQLTTLNPCMLFPASGATLFSLSLHGYRAWIPIHAFSYQICCGQVGGRCWHSPMLPYLPLSSSWSFILVRKLWIKWHQKTNLTLFYKVVFNAFTLPCKSD